MQLCYWLHTHLLVCLASIWHLEYRTHCDGESETMFALRQLLCTNCRFKEALIRRDSDAGVESLTKADEPPAQ